MITSPKQKLLEVFKSLTRRTFKLHLQNFFSIWIFSCCFKMQYWWHFHWKFTRLQTFFNFLFFSLHPSQVVKPRFTWNINISQQVLFAQSYRPSCARVENARKWLICCETPAVKYILTHSYDRVSVCMTAELFHIIWDTLWENVLKNVKFL